MHYPPLLQTQSPTKRIFLGCVNSPPPRPRITQPKLNNMHSDALWRKYESNFPFLFLCVSIVTNEETRNSIKAPAHSLP